MDQKINKCGACNNLYIGQPCPYCQLAAAEKRAEKAEKDAQEWEESALHSRTCEITNEQRFRTAEADRDRLRDAISRVEDWMHDDRAGMSALAAIIQDATGEAAIAATQQPDRVMQIVGELVGLYLTATPTTDRLIQTRYEHGGGRAYIDIKAGERVLIMDVFHERDRELYFRVMTAMPELAAIHSAEKAESRGLTSH